MATVRQLQTHPCIPHHHFHFVFTSSQVEAFCIANLIQSVMDSNDEFLVLDVHFAATNGGLQYAFELLHQVLQSPR
jgi:hypothetical protein